MLGNREDEIYSAGATAQWINDHSPTAPAELRVFNPSYVEILLSIRSEIQPAKACSSPSKHSEYCWNEACLSPCFLPTRCSNSLKVVQWPISTVANRSLLKLSFELIMKFYVFHTSLRLLTTFPPPLTPISDSGQSVCFGNKQYPQRSCPQTPNRLILKLHYCT